MTAIRPPSSDAQIPLPFALAGIFWLISMASGTGWDLTWLFVGFFAGLLIVFLVGYTGGRPASDPVPSPTAPVAIGFDRDAFYKPPVYDVPLDDSGGTGSETASAVAGEVRIAIDDLSVRLLDMERVANSARHRSGWVASTPGPVVDSGGSAGPES